MSKRTHLTISIDTSGPRFSGANYGAEIGKILGWIAHSVSSGRDTDGEHPIKDGAGNVVGEFRCGV